jgi:hypothetical protein
LRSGLTNQLADKFVDVAAFIERSRNAAAPRRLDVAAAIADQKLRDLSIGHSLNVRRIMPGLTAGVSVPMSCRCSGCCTISSTSR